jgi:nucleotide-binding universal stress UspA family protein
MFPIIHSLGVTTDFSETSRAAFPVAAGLARDFGARFFLLHVVRGIEISTPWQVAETSPALAEERTAQAQKRLEALAASEESFRTHRVLARALPGESAEALARFAAQQGIDLLVVASHGTGAGGMFPLGSFAAKVLHLAAAPVLLLHTPLSPRERAGELRPKRIIACHDFSSRSREGVEAAQVWAQKFEATTRMLHVVDRQAHLEEHILKPGESVEERIEKAEGEAWEQLRRLIRRDWEGLKVEPAVRIGVPAAEILKEAAEFAADLIVLASRGPSLIERLQLGSVAERVVHGARSPVLVVRRDAASQGFLA